MWIRARGPVRVSKCHTQLRVTRGVSYNSCPCGYIDLQKVFPSIPSKRCREESRTLVHISVPTKHLAVRANYYPVGALLLDTHTIVCETGRGVEIEDPEQTSPLKYDDLVAFVLQANVGLRRMEPAILLFGPLHFAVKFIKESVTKKVVINEIKLSAGVVKAAAIPFSGKVQPFWVPEFVALEV